MCDSRGFTMIELVVTMIVIGIMAFTILPKFDSIGTFDAAGYADQTASLFRYAQKTAIAQRRWTTVDIAAPSICSQTDLPAAGCTAGCTGGTAIAPPGGPPRTPAASTTTSGTTVLCFDDVGRPIAAGSSAPLAVATTLTIYDNGALFRTLTIEAETGYVH